MKSNNSDMLNSVTGIRITLAGIESTLSTLQVVTGVLFVLLLIFILKCVLSNQPPATSDKTPAQATKTQAKSVQMPENKSVSGVVKISSNSKSVPVEVYTLAARRAVPMNNEAVEFIKKNINPNLIGVPRVGEPVRVALELPVEEQLLEELMGILSKDQKGQVVFIKTQSPSTLMGFIAQLSGEMVNYCEDGNKNCENLDVYVRY